MQGIFIYCQVTELQYHETRYVLFVIYTYILLLLFKTIFFDLRVES